jgi:hypothetical protein
VKIKEARTRRAGTALRATSAVMGFGERRMAKISRGKSVALAFNGDKVANLGGEQ